MVWEEVNQIKSESKTVAMVYWLKTGFWTRLIYIILSILDILYIL